jgi:hypothetical protein
MSKVSSTASDAAQHDATEPIKSAIHSGMGAIETTVLAAAEIPLSVLKSLGVSDEAMEAAREGHRQLVRGIHSALDTVAMGVTDTTAGIASGITTGISTAATAAGDAAGKMASSSSSS